LLLSFSDTVLVGDAGNPWVLTLRGAYRGDTSETRPAHPEAGVGTTFQMFSNNNTGALFGNLGSFSFGNNTSRTALDQKYTSASANVNKLLGEHNLKFGWNFLRTKVDGIESQIQNLQLFATVPDFTNFGPFNAGFFTVTTAGGHSSSPARMPRIVRPAVRSGRRTRSQQDADEDAVAGDIITPWRYSVDVVMTAVSVDSLAALGFVLGLRHAIEADHLAAISTIVTERRSLLS
jgi:hypothetical protein